MNLLEAVSFPFVRYAIIVGVLISFCSSLFGTTLVLKRLSFIGDGLSHVAFGAIALSTIFNFTNNMPLVLLITMLSAVLILRLGQNTKIKGDSAIAMISVGALGVGYLLLNVFSKSSNLTGDVCSTLFGSTSILTLTKVEVVLSLVLSAVVIIIFVLFYNKLFCITFDEDFARATGVKTSLYNMLLALIIAVIIVLAMNLVGSLLVSALVIFPAISSMRVFNTFKSVTVCSAVLSVATSLAGILISVVFATPVGATVVAAEVIIFILFCIIGSIIKKIKN